MLTDSTHADFYVTVASVMPILLLALLWDSGFLRRLRTEKRTLRRRGKQRVPGDVLFWTKGRVLVYSLFVTAVVLCGIGAATSVLGDILPDSNAVRFGVVAVLMLELATIFTRIAVDLVAATKGSGGDRTREANPASTVEPPNPTTTN